MNTTGMVRAMIFKARSSLILSLTLSLRSGLPQVRRTRHRAPRQEGIARGPGARARWRECPPERPWPR